MWLLISRLANSNGKIHCVPIPTLVQHMIWYLYKNVDLQYED